MPRVTLVCVLLACTVLCPRFAAAAPGQVTAKVGPGVVQTSIDEAVSSRFSAMASLGYRLELTHLEPNPDRPDGFLFTEPLLGYRFIAGPAKHLVWAGVSLGFDILWVNAGLYGGAVLSTDGGIRAEVGVVIGFLDDLVFGSSTLVGSEGSVVTCGVDLMAWQRALGK